MAHKHMNKMLNITLIREMQIKTTMMSHLTWSERMLSKNLQTINAGEGVEKKEPSYTVGNVFKLVQPLQRTLGGSIKS